MKCILERVPVPEVLYRVDELSWDGPSVYGERKGHQYPRLPEYNPNPDLLWKISGLAVAGPFGKKLTWKVVYDSDTFSSTILDRYGLEKGSAQQILNAISWTPDGEIRRYPTEEAAKEAVEGALLKIGLVDPIVDVDEMHTVTGYDA